MNPDPQSQGPPHLRGAVTWSSCVKAAWLKESACSRKPRSLFCISDSNSCSSSWSRRAQGEGEQRGPSRDPGGGGLTSTETGCGPGQDHVTVSGRAQPWTHVCASPCSPVTVCPWHTQGANRCQAL